MTDHPSVHEAIAGVIRDLPAVGKDSEVTQGARYKYRGIEAIKAALKPLLAQHGVHYAPTTITEIVDSTYQTKQGDTWQRIRMIVGYTVYGPAGDSIPAVGRGEGADNSDKACNKAMTVAEKQMLVQVFCIADADGDPDASRRGTGCVRRAPTGSDCRVQGRPEGRSRPAVGEGVVGRPQPR